MIDLKTKLKALRLQVQHLAPDEIERMLNAVKGSGITPALIEACLRANRSLVVHSESWRDKLQAEHPKLKLRLPREVQGGEMVLIDNGINHMMLVETRALQKLVEDLLNYVEAKKIEDKP